MRARTRAAIPAAFACIAAAWLSACGGSAQPASSDKKSAGGSGADAANAGTTKSASGDTPTLPGANATADKHATDTEPTAAEPKVALDECGLHTQWAGDQYCIKAPPPDKGFQLHYGPDDYEHPDAAYVMQPGQETVENLPVTSGNENDVYYYFRQYRMRPGSHHLILYSGGAGGHRLGGSQNLVKDNPDRGVIAPENAGIGMKLAAKTPITLNLHYMNFSDKPTLKEVWVNFWYRDPNDVTDTASELFSPTQMNVPAGQHVVIRSSCTIAQPGRVLTLYGHRHANNVRFSAWRERGATKELIYDDYDWEDPLVLEYSSMVKNAPADPRAKKPGGWSGPLDLLAGDKLSFECEIINMSNKTFRGANEAKDDEMCILVGDTLGTTVPAFCNSTTTQVD
jgi:hypothetical protein